MTPDKPFVLCDADSFEAALAAGGGTNVITVLVTRAEVEGLMVDSIVERLTLLSGNPEYARKFADAVMFCFQGYDEDAREIYEIPEIRRYLSAVDKAWPYWIHFLNLEEGTWATLLCCLLDVEVVRQGNQVGAAITMDGDNRNHFDRWFKYLDILSADCCMPLPVKWASQRKLTVLQMMGFDA